MAQLCRQQTQHETDPQTVDDGFKLRQIATELYELCARIIMRERVVSRREAAIALRVVDQTNSAILIWKKLYLVRGADLNGDLTTLWHNLEEAIATYKKLLWVKRNYGRGPTGDPTIYGECLGRQELVDFLHDEMIDYSPEELIAYAKAEYNHAAETLSLILSRRPNGIKCSPHCNECGSSQPVSEQLTHMQSRPSRQWSRILTLFEKSITYVLEHGMVTVPQEFQRAFRARVLPLNYTSLDQYHGRPKHASEDSALESRGVLTGRTASAQIGNGSTLSRSMIVRKFVPGRALFDFMAERHHAMRSKLAPSAMLPECWGLYWETLLWQRSNFFKSCCQVHVRALFLRMDRSVRLIISLKFHLGKITHEECVNLLVDKMHYSRATATLEVRKFMGKRTFLLPYAEEIIGAWQLLALRSAVLDGNRGGNPDAERHFHDELLKLGNTPLKLTKALMLCEDLSTCVEKEWRFMDQPDVDDDPEEMMMTWT